VATGVRRERTRDRIIAYVKSAGTVAATNVAEQLGLSMPATRRQFGRLTAQGLLERVGRGRYRAVAVKHE
jgi:predicted ArsR family transcriptional regulator